MLFRSCRCWWGCDRCYRGIFAVQELGPERRVRSAYRLAAQSLGSVGASEPCFRFGNQHWKATGNSPSPTSSFADLNKAKPGVYQTGQLKVNGSDTTGSTQLGCPRREENQPPFRTAQQRQTLSNNLRQPRTPHNDPRPVATTPAVTSSQERRRAPTRRLADPPVGNSERSPRAASWSGRPHRANVLQLSNAHTVRRASSWIATWGHRLSKARSTEAIDFDHRIQRRR